MKRLHLLSCGGCKRQLDATALQVGDEVMCVCETLLTVGPPREVSIGGLVCRHCGGVLREEDTECGYCNAVLTKRDREETTLCPLCATRLPNDSNHCKRCGVELRSSAIPAIPRDGACPRCSGPLRVHLLPETEVVECGSSSGCGGVWTTREAFKRLQHGARAAVQRGEVSPAEVPVKGFEGPPKKREVGPMYIPCLTCGEHMQRRQFRVGAQRAGVVIDICKDHGIWFDRDELQRSLAMVSQGAAGHSDPGEDPQDQDLAFPSKLPGARTRPPSRPSTLHRRPSLLPTLRAPNALIQLLTKLGEALF